MKLTTLKTTVTALADCVMASGSALAQQAIDQNGNVYSRLPGYGELPELPEQPSLGERYVPFYNNYNNDGSSDPRTSSGFDFSNYERGLQLAQQWADREQVRQ